MDGEGNGRKRATVHDVARAAGVSLATVDRVLNGRPGVRPLTAEKVGRAIAELGFRRDLSASLLARARDLRVAFLLPDGGNEFMESLASALMRRRQELAGERIALSLARIPALDPAALAAAIDGLGPGECDCAVVVAAEDAAVHAAATAASRRGIVVLTLVSDLPGSARRAFIGIDNIAAGRTAASLMGRFLPAGGKVALVAGSLGLRDHRERCEGFFAAAGAFPRLEPLGPFEGHDAEAETHDVIARLLAEDRDLAGIYNLGAGNPGLVAALAASGRGGRVRVIAHELTPSSRRGLAEGLVDVVLDQNPEGEIRAAIAAARALALGQGEAFAPERLGIGIFVKDNMG